MTESQDGITSLDALKAIRARPEMYVPMQRNVRNHLLLEALCLSLAEAHCGSCTEIVIETSGRTAHIQDNGLGLSMEKDETGIPFAERIFTQLYACRDHKAHQALGHELCGSGIVTVNALSSSFTVQIHSDGALHLMEFTDGVMTQSLQRIGESSQSGTELRFTIAEPFAGTQEFDLASLRSAINARPIDLSRTNIVISSF
jgi:DNA gyrase subunit B